MPTAKIAVIGRSGRYDILITYLVPFRRTPESSRVGEAKRNPPLTVPLSLRVPMKSGRGNLNKSNPPSLTAEC
jgi:hypothetical protein